jgi:hypothetical protein
MDAEKQL